MYTRCEKGQESGFQLEEIFLPQGHVTMSGDILGELLTDI